MKSFNFIISLAVALLTATAAGIKLWFAYGIWATACYAAIFIALPVMIIVHEVGHILFGAAVKIKASPSFSVTGSSSCKIIPKTQKNLRMRLIFTAAGGLFVNFLFLVLGIVGFIIGDLSWLMVFMPASVYLLLLNGIPAQLSGGKTDGEVIRQLVKNEPEAEVMLAVLKIQAKILSGTPIEKLDKILLLTVPQIREDDESFIALTELRYKYFKAVGDQEQAEKYKLRFEELRQYL